MAINKQDSRLMNHKITPTGTVFTVPSSGEDFTTGSWLTTDLCLGEFGVQLTDNRVFVRTTDGIHELAVLGSTVSYGEVTTVGAVTSSIIEFTPTGKCVITVEALVSGAEATGFTAVCGARLIGTFYYDGATTMTQLGTTNSIINSLTGTESAIMNTDGVDKVRVRAVGVGGSTMDWSADINFSVRYL